MRLCECFKHSESLWHADDYLAGYLANQTFNFAFGGGVRSSLQYHSQRSFPHNSDTTALNNCWADGVTRT